MRRLKVTGKIQPLELKSGINRNKNIFGPRKASGAIKARKKNLGYGGPLTDGKSKVRKKKNEQIKEARETNIKGSSIQ